MRSGVSWKSDSARPWGIGTTELPISWRRTPEILPSFPTDTPSCPRSASVFKRTRTSLDRGRFWPEGEIDWVVVVACKETETEGEFVRATWPPAGMRLSGGWSKRNGVGLPSGQTWQGKFAVSG